jgi:hypothetical protein
LQNIWEEGCWVANPETVLNSAEEDSQLEIADFNAASTKILRGNLKNSNFSGLYASYLSQRP